MSPHKIIIYGCGGHSRSVTDVILSNDPHASLIFIDENARPDETIYGFPVLKYVLSIDSYLCFFAIGDNQKRQEKCAQRGKQFLTSVISKKAHLGYSSQIDKGCFIGNFSHIGPEVTLGENTIVNHAAIVEHEVQIGSYCHIGPNATISGRCKIEDFVFVGVGATVKDYINICPYVIIGAGATVVKDIVEPGTYVGTPAKKMAESIS